MQSRLGGRRKDRKVSTEEEALTTYLSVLKVKPCLRNRSKISTLTLNSILKANREQNNSRPEEGRGAYKAEKQARMSALFLVSSSEKLGQIRLLFSCKQWPHFTTVCKRKEIVTAFP